MPKNLVNKVKMALHLDDKSKRNLTRTDDSADNSARESTGNQASGESHASTAHEGTDNAALKGNGDAVDLESVGNVRSNGSGSRQADAVAVSQDSPFPQVLDSAPTGIDTAKGRSRPGDSHLARPSPEGKGSDHFVGHANDAKASGRRCSSGSIEPGVQPQTFCTINRVKPRVDSDAYKAYPKLRPVVGVGLGEGFATSIADTGIMGRTLSNAASTNSSIGKDDSFCGQSSGKGDPADRIKPQNDTAACIKTCQESPGSNKGTSAEKGDSDKENTMCTEKCIGGNSALAKQASEEGAHGSNMARESSTGAEAQAARGPLASGSKTNQGSYKNSVLNMADIRFDFGGAVNSDNVGGDDTQDSADVKTSSKEKEVPDAAKHGPSKFASLSGDRASNEDGGELDHAERHSSTSNQYSHYGSGAK